MKTAPDPKDILEFQFKQLSDLKISDGFSSVPAACNLIVVDGKRGLIYIACDNKITVLKSGDNADKNWKREFILSSEVSRLALNCDCSFLAVTLDHPTAYIYSAASFAQQTLELLREIKLSSTAENVHVLDLRWNPCIPGALCTITSDYTVGSFNITADKTSAILTILEKLEKLEVLCVAWSPKGKQVVVGCKNGNLLQLKPDLKVARNIVGPNPSIGSIIALLWISNYQFCAAYLDPQDSRINVLIIDAPKGEANATFTSYEDITYSAPGVEGEEAGPRYYFEHIPEWGLIVAASSGSCEIAVLGSRDNGITWEQWQLVDSGRAQLPLVRTSESYPVGLAVDKTTVNKLPWGGEGSTLPHPVPILHILGTSGQLCSFHMVNLNPGIPPVCSPPTEVVPAIQPRISLAPTEISFNLMGGVTSTPRPKQIDMNQEKPKTTATVSLFVDTPRVALPQAQVELNVPKSQVENVDTLSKVETVIPPSKEMNQQEKVGIDSNICIHTYQEECSLFEKELHSRMEIQPVDIGTANERNKLIEESEKMDKFVIELQDTTASLTGEISCLKNLLLQTFAWLEETKSRCSSDISNDQQGQGDNDKLIELRSQMYYVQSQLEQAVRVLDHDWLEHINKEKNKMKVPRLEFVYQNMLKHAQIIAKEKNTIRALVKKWKNLTRGDVTNSLNKSMANMSLISIMSPALNNTNEAIEQRCRTIASRHHCFSREKQSKLRDLLSRAATNIIKTSTPPPIHDRLKETLSSLTSPSPPNKSEEQKIKSKSELNPEKLMIAENLPVQMAKSPLASLDRIVANIGSIGSLPHINLQNRVPALSTASAPSQIMKIPQVDSRARTAVISLTPQTPTTMGQPRQTKPITVSLFGTPQTPKPASAIPSGIKPLTISEVSPFTSNPPRSSAMPLLAPSLIPTTVTATSSSKLSSKIDSSPFNSGTIKPDVSQILPISTGISSGILSSPPAPEISQVPPLQTSLQITFSASSPAQPSTIQVPSYPTTLKTSPPTVTSTSIGVKTSSTNNTTFSFASKPATSSPSNGAESLDLSAMGLDLQASSNNPVDESKSVTTTASNTFFGYTGTPSSGSISGEASGTPKAKAPGTVFGNSIFSSIFSGSTSISNATSAFGGVATVPAVKPPIFGGSATGTSPCTFGGATTSPPVSPFDGTAANPAKSVGSEIPAATPAPSGFESPENSSSTSIFGNISSTANSASIFGGNSNPILNTSALGGSTALPAQVFGAGTTSPTKPSIFSGDSVTSPPASVFGRPTDSKPSVFGAVSSSPPILSPFGTGTTGAPSGSIFGGNIASPTFGSSASSPNTASVFGAVPSMAPNQSIFGGTASNIGAVAPSPAASVSAFGQAASFGVKPEFGGSVFDTSKPIFGGSGFGGSAFPAPSQPTSGFGGFNTTPMGGGSMQKVFGESGGNSTFENLAAQGGGLTFGNLAQKQAESAPPPAFSEKSSFQSWR